jgi:hypothetical protein
MTNKSSAIDILCMGIFSLVRFRHPYLGEYSRFVNLSFHISRILIHLADRQSIAVGGVRSPAVHLI